MARAGLPHWTVALFATVALSGCVEGGKPLASGADEAGATTTSTRQGDRDVEAPEVFQVTGQGLWDGRPSLGGVWVATPDATDPERVMIRNTSNGKVVIGALFKRERDNPGPPIQISSDAAAALGLLAGQPAEVNVTALRRDAPAAKSAEPVLAASEPTTETPAAPAAEAATALDTTAVAAAIDKADPKAKPADAAAPETAVAAAAPEPAPKKKWWQRKPKAEATAPVADAAALEGATAASGSAAPASLAPAEVTSAPLAAAPSKPASAPAAKGGTSLIQLGIFSVEENAERAADMVKKAGAPATVRSETSNGKPYWSVVAGPASTPAERDALMAKVKGLGFTDAYVVSR